MLNSKKLFLTAIMAFVFIAMQAQTSSPYSRYGYGMLRDQAVGPSKAMGGIGYGMRNSLAANPMNPASYSAVDSLTFLFDLGLSAYSTKISDQSGSKSDYNGNLDYMTMLMPLSKKMGMSLGILPYSSVGYTYGYDGKEDDKTFRKLFAGSGGFSQVYIGLGYSTPLKGLSIGFNANYLFGTIQHQQNTYFTNTLATSIAVSDTRSLSQLKFDLGLQYQTNLNKNNKLVLGAIFTPAIHPEIEKTKIDVNGETRDTTAFKTNGGIPMNIGGGFTIHHKNKLVLGADITYQGWKNIKNTENIYDDGLADNARFNNVLKYNVGGEYTIDPSSRKFFERIKFRGGVNYSNSYLNVNTTSGIKSFNQYGATLGFGFPIRDREAYGNRTSYVNVNFEYRKVNPEVKTMVREEYFGISVNANINELWFMKRKIF